MVNTKATPVDACENTKAKIAKIKEINVEAIADSWGLLLNGTAIKNDQLARERPRRTCTTSTRPTFVAENTR
jgi:hypothetical protein